jgi:hypothetical protein
MFVYLLPRKKIRSEDTGKNAGSVRDATAGQTRQVEELRAHAHVPLSPSVVLPGAFALGSDAQ